MRLGAPEILIIIAVFVLLFGAKKIPDLAKGLGDGIRQFKSSVREPEDEPKEEEKKL